MMKTPPPVASPFRPPTLAETAARAVEGRVLLTYRDAARILGYSRSQMYKLVAAGDLVAAGEGRSRRVTAASILAFVVNMPTSDDRRPRAMDAA